MDFARGAALPAGLQLAGSHHCRHHDGNLVAVTKAGFIDARAIEARAHSLVVSLLHSQAGRGILCAPAPEG